MLEIITGYTGIDHVTSADDASLYRSFFGAEDVVLNVGSQFEHTIISNNLIKIADGDLVIQGHQARIRTNDYEEVVIDNGTPGMQRHDLIVARYEKDGVSGIESIKLAVVKGVAGAAAVDPELTQDDITSGGTLREFPLYRVKLNGINIEAVEKMFRVFRIHEWEGPYSLSLINGWTGNINYEKSSTGIVYISGLIVPGVTNHGVRIAELPEGFRPKNRGRAHSFVVMQSGNNTAHIGFNITSGGVMFIRSPASDEISTTLGIQFHTMFRGG